MNDKELMQIKEMCEMYNLKTSELIKQSETDKNNLFLRCIKIIENKSKDMIRLADSHCQEMKDKEAYIYALRQENEYLKGNCVVHENAIADLRNYVDTVEHNYNLFTHSRTYRFSQYLYKLLSVIKIVPALKGIKKMLTKESTMPVEGIINSSIDTLNNKEKEQTVETKIINKETLSAPNIDLGKATNSEDKSINSSVLGCIKEFYNYAQIQHSTREVNAFTVQFLRYSGSSFFAGGAERYLMDLKEVCDELNTGYRIYQYGEYNWIRFVGDVEIIGLCPNKNNVNEFNEDLRNEMDELFTTATSENTCVNIYSAFNVHTLENSLNTIGISHGIFWDNPGDHYYNTNHFWKEHKEIIDSARLCEAMVSVDTNTCNWFQTIDYDLGRKIHYIPNYVDTDEFIPRKNYLSCPEKIVITYPRRLYAPRGLYAVLDIIDDILFRFENIEFHFVGRGYEEDTRHVEEKIKQWNGRVKWYSKMPEEMYQVYQNTDITLIPTMYSEGTSLSCLEALSSGNVVIATRIGGLSDLIINGYNGVLVEPNSFAIYDALTDILNHPKKMLEMKENARKSAHVFSKTKWKESWRNILREYTTSNKSEGEDSKQLTEVQRCIVELKDIANIEKKEIKDYLLNMLKNGWYMYVRCSGNGLKSFSYQRIQFIDTNEILYFTPEKTITEDDIIQINE